jgi:cytochrome c
MKYAPLALLLVLSACGSKPEDATVTAPTNEVAVADPNAAPPAFAQCATCHSVQAGVKTGLGPNLHGVIGRKSGAQEGFYYSAAMKAANLTWDEATLDKFLEKPMVSVPGTRMSYAGQSDAAKRAAIIAWLKTQS